MKDKTNRLLEYRRAKIVPWAFAEGLGLFALAAVLQTGNLAHGIFALLLGLYIVIRKPSQYEMEQAVGP
jgi:hypothetical protein